MLVIVTSIICCILHSVLKKPVKVARIGVAGKLKDGDIANEKWRVKIDEDLNIIKKKLDGLSRKDLLASYCFLKEGIETLNLALEEVNRVQNDGSNATTTSTTNESQSEVVNETVQLSYAILQLKSASSGRFVRAENRFRDARREATRAFCNEALSLPDRIMAAQLRVISNMLECLQDTKVAVNACMLFLRELHDLPALRETFSVYCKDGIKARFFKNSRLEIVKSVLSLNFAVSELVARFSGELPNVGDWPRIHLSTRGETIHPLLFHVGVFKEIFDKEEFQLPKNHVILNKFQIDLSSLL